MLEREVPCFRTRKSTIVGGSSTNLLEKAANATITSGTSVMHATTQSNHSNDATTRTMYARDNFIKNPRSAFP